MGQRNMVYLLIENATTKDKEDKFDAIPLYFQWNFIKVQIPKLIRGIKFLNSIKSIYPWVLNEYLDAFRYSMQLADGGFIPCNNELSEYDENYTLFNEDNNNGWNIVYIRIIRNPDTNEYEFEYQFIFIAGTSDEDGIELIPNERAIRKIKIGNYERYCLHTLDYMKLDAVTSKDPQDDLYFDEKKYKKMLKINKSDKSAFDILANNSTVSITDIKDIIGKLYKTLKKKNNKMGEVKAESTKINLVN